MKQTLTISLLALLTQILSAQDLSYGLMVNDLSLHPMQAIAKPAYLDTIIDPAFGTTIRRISNAADGEVIVPMYSTIQAWNADESLMILYHQTQGRHLLLDGMTYMPIRSLDDVQANDIEQVFWDFDDPNIFYYHEAQSDDFIQYTVDSQQKEILVNLKEVAACTTVVEMGNDIQMMSWDSDVLSFRCGNESAYSYRLSTAELQTFSITDLEYNSPAVAPSGQLFYHNSKVYDAHANVLAPLNQSNNEHACMGQLANGQDAYFAIAFEEGPEGACIGDIIAHDLHTAHCFPLISQSQAYDYPQSGTHISALAHKNTEGGWLAASMIGYDQDGQSLLDQELVIVKADQEEVKVCRIGHHRSDEDEFDYWGEPHAVISPSGTRVLFASDWSGVEDGVSVDAYVVELPAFSVAVATTALEEPKDYVFYPNPVADKLFVNSNAVGKQHIRIYDINGVAVLQKNSYTALTELEVGVLKPGLYVLQLANAAGVQVNSKFVKQ